MENVKRKLQNWAQKMLDLSKSNRLVNIAQTKKILPLAVDDAAAMEDALVRRGTLQISADGAKGAREGELASKLDSAETLKRLKEIYRSARRALEESGANTLFLAVGALVWHEQGKEGKKYRAPVVLIPVALERRSVAGGYSIRRIDEEASVNQTLLELLKRDAALRIPELENPPADEAGLDIAAILQTLAKAVESAGFTVENDCALGIFSFGKFEMWRALSENADAIASNPLVKHLAERPGAYDDGIAVFPPEEISQHIDYREMCCPLGADSSQLAAVLYSGMGKSFILHGPPGTGKSQTITNIIAHNLWLGRRVLFVAEKKAALDVVRARLAKLSLAPFCLALHSEKDGKAEIYAQFREALEAAHAGDFAQAAPAASDAAGAIGPEAQLSIVSRQLDGYVKELHAPIACGLSASDIIARMAVRGETAPSRDAEDAARRLFGDARVSGVGKEEYDGAVRTLGALAALRADIGAEAVAALRGIRAFAWSPAAEADFAAKAAALEKLFGTLEERWCGKGLTAKARAAVRALVRRFGRAGADIAEIREALAALAALATPPERAAAGDLAAAKECAAALAKHAPGNLRTALMYMAERAKTPAFALPAADAIDSAKTAEDAAAFACAESFADAFQTRALDEILAASPALGTFSGEGRESLVKRFRELDDTVAKAAAAKLVAKLKKNAADALAGAPQARKSRRADASEAGILMHECGKKIRHMGIRRLLSLTPNITSALKPCFLMSPLAAAKYLEIPGAADADGAKERIRFDLVVFDEASQISVWDAAGTIACARQLIVVGDPKQLPPTNFFKKNSGEDESEESDDLESLLDECLHAGLPSCHLMWHFRSRHDSLIAFSNKMYYGSRLRTFPPAADSGDLGVSFLHVPDGIYDASATRTNRREAEAVAALVREYIVEKPHPGKTLGVVAFSEAQRNLIEDLIDDMRGADGALDAALAAPSHEPFFVKNLENVQGDERDAIFFSVGYAPDKDGKFNMVFGPLSASGGERRLNVAITRAREKIVVVSSIHAAQIDTSRISSKGPADLRAFLDFAEKRTLAAADSREARSSATAETGEARSGAAAQNAAGASMADAVAAELEKRGYAVVRGEGAGRAAIDIAVRDKTDPSRFAFGVICDGRAYAAERTTRDRDRLRDDVLASLGWKIRHVWAADWLFAKDKALRRLLDGVQTPGA